MGDRDRQPRDASGDLSAWLWRAAFVGVLMVLLGSMSWLLLGTWEAGLDSAVARRDPRTIAAAWASVADGQRLADVIHRMGPPDRDEQEPEPAPNCPGPSDSACESVPGCVRRYEWVSEDGPEQASTYAVCVDSGGIVRSVSTGLRFSVCSVGPCYDDAAVAGWAVAGVVFGVPLAGGLLLKRRLWPRAATGLALRS